ncbi:MAG: hypothetical protein EAZ08_12360 [Cytophagales bacterium]|nr:MAG: hypothetical protein EAZ08_12360 [Cytophagales bacterium]
MTLIRQLYTHFQVLSIDVVLGCVVNTLLIAKYCNVIVPNTVLCALASATWLIYTADHLADATKLKEKASSDRHLFHFKYRKALIIFSFILLIINILNLFYLPILIIKAGFYLSLGVLVYFFFLRLASGQPSLFKEISIAFIYAVAIFLAPAVLSTKIWNTATYLLFVSYFLLALINLLEFSLFDLALDEKEQYSSLIRKLGKSKSKKVIGSLIYISFLWLMAGTIYLYYNDFTNFSFFHQIQICLFFMNVVLATLLLFPSYFVKNNRYRVFGDMVFLFPVFLF